MSSDEKEPLKSESASAIRVNEDAEADFYESNEEEDQLRAKDLSPLRPKLKDDDLIRGKIYRSRSVMAQNFCALNFYNNFAPLA